MNPSELLQKLLSGQSSGPRSGVVSKVEGRSVYVVDKGSVRAVTSLPGDVSQYRPGDVVRLDGGVLLGKSPPRPSKYFYL